MRHMQEFSQNIAFVHDYLQYPGGAERVLSLMRTLYPEAPVFTLLYDEKRMEKFFPKELVVPSFLQRLPGFLRSNPRYLAPLLPIAVESFDLRDFPVVISSSSAFAKGVITRAHTLHICYCHTPARYLWDFTNEYRVDTREKRFFAAPVKIIQHYLRLWDRVASERVHYYIANSKAVAARIKKYYRREATVIYPPVNVSSYSVSRADGGYYLIVSRLVPYKRVDLAVAAFNKLQLPLVVAGDGPERKKLAGLAGKTVSFVGEVTEKKKHDLIERCSAFIFPGEDDFGIAPVEAMAAGKPVLALRRGGAVETVAEGVSGEFFDDPVPEVLADGVRRLRENRKQYSPELIRRRAEAYSSERFLKEFQDFLISAQGNIIDP
jgi:glycosyltransferase involved in cell wall biosynthesis